MSTFEPITLSVTVNSKEELIELWHRLGLAIDDVNDCSNEILHPKIEGEGYESIDNFFWDANSKLQDLK